MIVAAAVCPHPPLLAPEVAPGTGDELADLRDACQFAVAALLAAGPDRVVVLGAGDLPGELDESAAGTLAPYGAAVRAGADDAEPTLPLALTIGAWLLDAAGWTGPRTYTTTSPVLDDDEVVALLVMADGTTKRSDKAPGHLDGRAQPFDATVAAALSAGDPQALAALDLALGTELGSSGVPPLHALARLVADETARGATVVARVRFDGAPLGVGYVVADWAFTR